MDNWIESKKALPVVGEYVLVLLEGETMLKGRLCSNGWSAFFADGEKLVGTRDVTHWTHLPALPDKTAELGKDIHAFPVLTKREIFAGLALQGLCANEFRGTVSAFASRAVELADSLLTELSTPQP